MDGARQESPPTAWRFRWSFSYGVDGDVRFISHHDTLRLFQRAFARAAVPVRYSAGFNPHPKLMIPLPRPVGIASQAEVVVIETQHDIDVQDALQRLRRCTPPGIDVRSARALEAGERMQPVTVRYKLDVEPGTGDELRAKIAEVRAATELIVERIDPKSRRTRTIDIKPFLAELDETDDGVEFTIRTDGGGSAKPAEIAGLLGFDAKSINHRIRRMEVQWR